MAERDFSGGLMARMEDFRPSLNIQRGNDDALVKLLTEAGATMPDEVRQRYGLSALTPETRDALVSLMNDRRTVSPTGDDRFDLYRWQQAAPGPNARPTPEMLDALISGPSLSGPSYLKQNDDAQFAGQIAGMLQGQQSPPSASSSAISSAAGDFDPSFLARLFGRRY